MCDITEDEVQAAIRDQGHVKLETPLNGFFTALYNAVEVASFPTACDVHNSIEARGSEACS